MRLRGHQLDGFNAALKSGDAAKAHQELQTACARAEGIVPFVSASGCAALLEIIGACEKYQNTDFEGMDDDQRANEGYKCSMEVIRIASAALQKNEAQHNG